MLMYTFYAQHRTAIESSVEVIRRVRSDMLTLPTPCAGWTLADLLTRAGEEVHALGRVVDRPGMHYSGTLM